jgi:hypothetical protein
MFLFFVLEHYYERTFHPSLYSCRSLKRSGPIRPNTPEINTPTHHQRIDAELAIEPIIQAEIKGAHTITERPDDQPNDVLLQSCTLPKTPSPRFSPT